MSSVEVTQRAMGFEGFTASAENCGACFHSHQVPSAPGHARSGGIRCIKGAFFTVRKATCKQFQPAPGNSARIQIGPTDI